MDFYIIITIVTLLILIICLTLFGLYYNAIRNRPFPETQEICPKFWKFDNSGNCIKPTSTDTSFNNLISIPDDTPGLITISKNGFNSNDVKWASYKSAKNSICGKKKWADANNISWDGISNYNSC